MIVLRWLHLHLLLAHVMQVRLVTERHRLLLAAFVTATLMRSTNGMASTSVVGWLLTLTLRPTAVVLLATLFVIGRVHVVLLVLVLAGSVELSM